LQRFGWLLEQRFSAIDAFTALAVALVLRQCRPLHVRYRHGLADPKGLN
jgi:hypothetical protein